MRKGLVLFRLSALLVAGLMFAGCDTGFGRSGNADLSRLEIEGVPLDPGFRSDETEYTARVTTSITRLTVNAATEDDETATMTLNGTRLANNTDAFVDLVLGRNEINIVVTAENESTKTYEVVVTQVVSDSDDADLSNLDVAFTPVSSEFEVDSSAYDFDVSYWVNTVFVSFVRSDDDASVELSTQSASLGDNQVSDPISLTIGEDVTITLDVTSGNEDVEQSYSVDLNRAARSSSGTYFKASNTGAGDQFGTAIAADVNTLVVGAYKEQSTSQSDAGNDVAVDGAGAVYIFDYSASSWAEPAYIKRESTITEGDEFGRSVAIDGDTLVIGAPGAESVHVYTRSITDVWTQNQVLIAADAESEDVFEFGFSVNIEGDYLLVGAPAKAAGQGAVYIFEWNGNLWVPEEGDDEVTSDGSIRFGEIVQWNDVSRNPEFIVGVPQANSGQGEIFVYELDTSTSPARWPESVNLNAESNASDDDNFGASVSILNGRIAVGAPGKSGSGTGVDADSSSSESNLNTGAVYLYELNSQGVWALNEFIKAPKVSDDMKFGTTVALSADMLAVGAPFEDSGATTGIESIDDNTDNDAEDSGAVYVYEFVRATSTWKLDSYVKSQFPVTLDHFGASLFFSGDNLVVGVPDEDSSSVDVDNTYSNGASQAGAVYLYR